AQSVLRSGRLEPRSVGIPNVPGGWRAQARSAIRGRKSLQYGGLRQSAEQRHVRNVRRDHGGGEQQRCRGLSRAANPARRQAPLLTVRLFGVCAAIVVAAQTSLPPLPRLALDAFPSQTRDALSRPYAAALSRPTDVSAVGTLARTLHAWDQLGAAHETYARAQALAPAAFEWQYLDGVALQRLARPEEAAARFEAALRRAPDYLPPRAKLADALLDSGDLDRAEQLYQALAREPAAEPVGEFGLGRIAAARLQHEAAVAHLERAVALFPEFGAAYYALARSYRL